MVGQGIPDDVIIDEIKKTASTYDMDTQTVQYLKDKKVSEKVIEMDKQLQEKSRQDLEEFDQLSAEQKTEMQKEFVKQPEVTNTAEAVDTIGIPF